MFACRETFQLYDEKVYMEDLTTYVSSFNKLLFLLYFGLQIKRGETYITLLYGFLLMGFLNRPFSKLSKN